MKELTRYPIAGTDAALIHVEDRDGDEYIWIALCPMTPFEPARQGETFIVASSEDGFAGLAALTDTIAKCSAGCRS